MSAQFPAIEVAQLTGRELFSSEGRGLGFAVGAFWSWAASDLANNALRGMLAEFLVGRALGTADGVRVEWDAYDCTTRDGKKVEVKSAAYLQSWAQSRLSPISFGISRTRAWEAETNDYSGEARRQADVYVFCLLKTKNQEDLDPLDVDQWEFFVVATSTLDDELGEQKSLGLGRLRSLARPVAFISIAEAVEAATA